ncbi:hypothetical protein H6P81_018648 [Aristolochia fimbriata]|uniref:Reverse transcriptase zinc-binding domain-containing protein n=1 Tax=Aristolochia fimbriata TaxID=158543 RepID=A0AAV7E3N1_ARIFI|nr:hypothetical protein H6P81_018648 [Aristolochia fimbriata]
MGGLGIRDLKKVNTAFLWKWCWKLNTDHNSAWSQLVRSNLGVDGSDWVLDWHSPRRLSVIWRYISKLLTGFRNRLRWAVGNEAFPRLLRIARSPTAIVGEIMADEAVRSIDWNRVFRRELRDGEMQDLNALDKMLQMFYRDSSLEDRLIWTPSTEGCFSVSSGYMSQVQDTQSHISSKAWSLSAPPKVQFFIWSALHEKILTREMLSRRGIPIPSQERPLCEEHIESIHHLLLHDEDLLKGQAVKNQKEPMRSSFYKSDGAIDEVYNELVISAGKTLNCILELEEAIVEKNPSITQVTSNKKCCLVSQPLTRGYDIKTALPICHISPVLWHKILPIFDPCETILISPPYMKDLLVVTLYIIAPFRNSAVDKWHKKTQVTTGRSLLDSNRQFSVSHSPVPRGRLALSSESPGQYSLRLPPRVQTNLLCNSTLDHPLILRQPSRFHGTAPIESCVETSTEIQGYMGRTSQRCTNSNTYVFASSI